MMPHFVRIARAVKTYSFKIMDTDTIASDTSSVTGPDTSELSTNMTKKASLVGLPEELRWKILKFYLRGQPDIGCQFPTQINGRLVPHGSVHATMLVCRELHSSYIYQAERSVMYVVPVKRFREVPWTERDWSISRPGLCDKFFSIRRLTMEIYLTGHLMSHLKLSDALILQDSKSELWIR